VLNHWIPVRYSMAAADAVADDLQDQREAAAAQQDADPVTRSIAIQGDMIAVATGRHWRVIDFRYSHPVAAHTDRQRLSTPASTGCNWTVMFVVFAV